MPVSLATSRQVRFGAWKPPAQQVPPVKKVPLELVPELFQSIALDAAQFNTDSRVSLIATLSDLLLG